MRNNNNDQSNQPNPKSNNNNHNDPLDKAVIRKCELQLQRDYKFFGLSYYEKEEVSKFRFELEAKDLSEFGGEIIKEFRSFLIESLLMEMTEDNDNPTFDFEDLIELMNSKNCKELLNSEMNSFVNWCEDKDRRTFPIELTSTIDNQIEFDFAA